MARSRWLQWLFSERRLGIVLAAALAGSCSSVSDIPVQTLPAAGPGKISRGLEHLLSTSGESEVLTVMVDLREQLDLERLARQPSSLARSRRRQGDQVRQALAHIAARSDRSWKPYLRGLQEQGLVQSWSRLTIVNRLLVTGRPAMVSRLAERPDVAAIVEEIRGQDALLAAGSEGNWPMEPWPLKAMHAEFLHRRGIDGRGIVVGVIDSGASHQHETLRENFRGGQDSWFDPLRNSSTPTDSQTGHGTSVLSCAVGRGEDGRAFGVAPGASWVAAVGLDVRRYHNIALARAADWMLNVGRPDVLIAPWRLPEDCDPSLRRIVNTWRLAGMVVVFAAGNSGPNAGTGVAPADYSDLLPDSAPAMSIGALSQDLQVYEKSSRGPNRCGPAVFPQLVAPGSDVPVAFPISASVYRSVSGTSFAAGYAAGAAALLLQRFPDLPAERIEQALRETATDLGDAGADSIYGYGLIDAAAALRRLETPANALHPP